MIVLSVLSRAVIITAVVLVITSVGVVIGVGAVAMKAVQLQIVVGECPVSFGCFQLIALCCVVNKGTTVTLTTLAN
jgi:lysylphosphatidylglycerol synthetase-like protein (DUF2156 family)